MMTRAEIEFFESLTERQLRNDSCICRSHRAEAKRHLANPDYVPKWNKEKSQLYICCSLDECTATSHNFKIIRLSEDTKQKLLTSQDTLCEFHCGAGCECKHCSNIQSVTQPQEEDDVSESEEEAEESETDQNNETESEEIETEVICDFIQNYI
jgi:hypothetical protein